MTQAADAAPKRVAHKWLRRCMSEALSYPTGAVQLSELPPVSKRTH